MDDPDRTVRQRAFEKINEAWEPQVELAAMALNAQPGSGSFVSKSQWQSPVYEPLLLNRLSQDSLMRCGQRSAGMLAGWKPYIDAKKRLLGIDKWQWYDEFVLCGQSETLMPFDKAADFVIEQLSRFSPELASSV